MGYLLCNVACSLPKGEKGKDRLDNTTEGRNDEGVGAYHSKHNGCIYFLFSYYVFALCFILFMPIQLRSKTVEKQMGIKAKANRKATSPPKPRETKTKTRLL